MDLREKLRQFESDFDGVRRESYRRSDSDIDLFIAGEEVSNEYGRYFRSITVYPETHTHGRVSLDLLRETDPRVVGLVGRDDALTGIDLRRAVFIDTETTGLAGGTGTVPFLVGLGYFYDDGFRVDQFFMRDYDEEHAVLSAVQERLAHCDALVSYNGKAYDLNLLTSRFTLARMEHSFFDLPHLDLLFTARRLWRRRIGDCSLSNVEERILDFRREGDVPGYLIPSLYFDYIRTRDGSLLKSVFIHNRWDIVTLVALAAVAGRIYESPKEFLNHPLDMLSLGRAFEGLELHAEAAECYRDALNYGMEPEERLEVLRLLGFSLKRMGDWERAVKVWEYMVEITPHRFEPYVELAKYYEHHINDFERAVEVVRRALERIRISEALRSCDGLSVDLKDLEYRLARLERKRRGRRGNR
ncbi:MAG: ribonuclease H-like domain-containing protein [bacterium]